MVDKNKSQQKRDYKSLGTISLLNIIEKRQHLQKMYLTILEPTINFKRYSKFKAVHEAVFEALGQREKNNRKNLEWWNDELKALRVEKENAYKKWLCNRTKDRVQRLK